MLNRKPSSKWNYTKIFSLFFHLPAVVWTTRWTIVKICSVIVRFSSELVEISSEPVWNSSELVSIILELLIISVFRETRKSVSRPFILWCSEGKGELWVFSFIKLFVIPLTKSLTPWYEGESPPFFISYTQKSVISGRKCRIWRFVVIVPVGAGG